MTDDIRSEKTEEMLRYYRARMAESSSVPILCVGTGIGPNRGKATVCIPDGVPPKEIYLLLKQLVELMEPKL